MSRLLEDKELQEAFRRGEEAALEEVYQEYSRPLYAMLSRGFSFGVAGLRGFINGFSDPHAREDAVQEVFLRAFAPRARLAYDGVTPYRNYLFVVARNILIDSARMRRRDFDCPYALREPDAETVLLHPELAFAHAQVERYCDHFISSLDQWDRELFEVRFHEGHSLEEAARRMHTSEYRVKQAEKSLRKRLFHAMKALGYFEGFRWSPDGVEKVVGLPTLVARAPR